MLLEHLTWPEVKKIRWAGKLVLFPFGSFEQHGHHLPLTTDTDIVTAIARRLEAKRPEKILCLPLFGRDIPRTTFFFPGTLSVSQLPYIELVRELCRSVVKMGARKIFLLNGHGGNDVPLRAAVRELKPNFQNSPLSLLRIGPSPARASRPLANPSWAVWVTRVKWKPH